MAVGRIGQRAVHHAVVTHKRELAQTPRHPVEELIALEQQVNLAIHNLAQ